VADFSSKAAALAVLAAVETGDVDDEAVSFLERFLIEAATGRYEMFKKSDAPNISTNPNYARAVLRAWRRVGSSRGKMAARMAFETILTLARRKN
jgi:hypothetical protein